MLQQLKKNLSTEALKGFRGETSSTPLKSRARAPEGTVTPSTGNSIQVVYAQPNSIIRNIFL